MTPHILLRAQSFPWCGNVRTLTEEDGTILFCGKDVAEALGYANPTKAVREHCRGGLKRTLSTKCNNRFGEFEREIELSFITEPDLYRLIVASKLPSAQKFERRFVCLGIFINNDRPVVSSRDIARVFEKEHKNVMQNIRNLECSPAFAALNFQPGSYKDAQNQERPEYLITRDGFSFLAMGFNGAKAAEFKEKYIAALVIQSELYRPPKKER